MKLGNHWIYHGDFLRNWQRVVEGTVRLVFTDPPFGTQRRKYPWDVKSDFAALAWIWYQLLTPDGQIAILHSPGLVTEIEVELQKYFVRRYITVFQKPSAMAKPKDRPRPDIDFLSVFHLKGSRQSDHTYNWKDVAEIKEPYRRVNRNLENSTMLTQKRRIDENPSGHRFPHSVEHVKNRPGMEKEEKKGVTHPMQKSLAAVTKQIRLLSNPGDLVLDPFLGSGTTLIASEQAGRRSIGFEIERAFFDESVARLKREISRSRQMANVSPEQSTADVG